MVKKKVIQPIVELEKLFDNPETLNKHRNGKKLDYDRMVRRNQQGQVDVSEVETATKNYRALHQRLVEDLPPFIDQAAKIFGHLIDALLSCRFLIIEIWCSHF